MTLYHFTSFDGWAGIRTSGQLEARSYQTSSFGDLPLLWLTDRSDGQGIGGDPQRLQVRIAVQPERGVHPWLIARFEAALEGRNLDWAGTDPDSWFVTTQAIPQTRWLTAVDHKTDEVLWSNEQPPPGSQVPADWALSNSDITRFEARFLTSLESLTSMELSEEVLAKLQQDSRFDLFTLLTHLPDRLSALRDSRADTTEVGQYRTWLCWLALNEDAALIPGFTQALPQA
ncbi:hypothetical protein DR950_18165 [Kitasatospora xanthocidica]|uniref:Uncharacterized protein n=1 Tax=Kitasatospora xanthocidica TaxID=83382 RepID=A0A372ZUM8_9ACTN|nr:hypothetical protein [Kitasatospora xanthocidica]RGD59461.1 hypothetical protein DR950_18165 [Kitasatospora xanthocidica]